MKKLERISDADFVKIVENVISYTALCESIGYRYRSSLVHKLKERVAALNISTTHFRPIAQKYFPVIKICPVCKIEFQTVSGGKNSSVCCGHSCANFLSAKDRDQVAINEKIKIGQESFMEAQRLSGKMHQKLTIVCQRCGIKFTVPYAKRTRILCSRTCVEDPARVAEENEANKENAISEREELDRFCEECGAPFKAIAGPPAATLKRFCSHSCASKIAGRASAAKQVRRSLNEIYFGDLCKGEFVNISFNEQMFNGWDADVILKDIRVAVLWNGAWHYKEGITKDHSLAQVQTRDRIKLDEIARAGYEAYVIKDLGKENKRFVEEEFLKFLEYVNKE